MGACSAAIMQFENKGEAVVAKTLSSRFEPMYKGHAERLLPMIEEVMAEACVSFDEIDRLAVTVGPGTFTGVRIGVATARGLALASQKPIVTSSSLHIIALTWLGQHEMPAHYDEIVIVLDARRGDVYLQRFTPTGAVIDQAQMLSLEAASRFLEQKEEGYNRLLLGEGALLLEPRLTAQQDNPSQEDTLFLPNAYYLAQNALMLDVSKERISPLYLRAADAKIQIGKAIKRKEG